jgi:hypothetical protein
MAKRLLALCSFFGGIAWPYFWEFVRTWIYEKAQHVIEPYIPSYDVALHYGPAVVLVCVGVWSFYRTGQAAKESIPIQSATATAAFVEDIPDLRVADSPLAIELFEGAERDKLLPLLEAEKLGAWARPMRGEKPGRDAAPVILKGDVWRTHYLQFFPKEGQWERAQTFLKTKARHETSYYDVLLNRAQIERIWPEQMSLFEAATRYYEAAEEAGVLDLVSPSRESPDDKLTHIKLLLMIDERIELRGIRPPSTKSRPLSKTELTDDLLYPGKGNTSQINHSIADEPVYLNVTIRNADLMRVIAADIAEAKRHKK